MFTRIHLVASASLVIMLGGAVPAAGQYQPGSAVDRNVGDTGPNAASQRHMQPGIGQFGDGVLLLDRYGNDDPYQTARFDPFAGDPRVSQRYLMQTAGVYALIDRPDYIGLSPQGGWTYNQQTIDGTEILTLTPANTVFILSPELLGPRPLPQDAEYDGNGNRLSVQQQQAVGDPYAMMRSVQGTQQPANAPPGLDPRPTYNTYRHPEIIERERKLREEREQQAQAKAQSEQEREQEQAEAKQPMESESEKNPDAAADKPASESADSLSK